MQIKSSHPINVNVVSHLLLSLSINPSNLSAEVDTERVAGGSKAETEDKMCGVCRREKTFIIFSRSVASSLIKVAAERNQQRAH